MAFLQFKHFITFLPPAWQANRIRRVSVKLMRLMRKEAELHGKLRSAETQGSMKKVERLIKQMVGEEKQELKSVVTMTRKEGVLEFKETERLGLINQRLRFLSHKIGHDKAQELIQKINAEIRKMEALEDSQKEKVDKLAAGGEIFVRAMTMKEDSLVKEIGSIAQVERPLIRKISTLEGRIGNLAEKINAEKEPERMKKELDELEKDINQLPSLIDSEVKYYSESVKDIELFLVFVRQQLKHLEMQMKAYVQQGFDKDLADKLTKKIEAAFQMEIDEEVEMVKDFRWMISQAQRQYAKAA